jgi:hypothetical protein
MLSLLFGNLPPPLGLEFSFITIPPPPARGWRCRKPKDGGGVNDAEAVDIVTTFVGVGEGFFVGRREGVAPGKPPFFLNYAPFPLSPFGQPPI